MTLRVLAPGLRATIQDRGRIGAARLGVPRGGPADPFAFRAAAALARTDVAIEVYGPPFTFALADARVIACAGRDVALRVGGRRVPGWTAALARAGEEVTVRGTRIAYVAVSGGVAAERVLGSRSAYLPAGIGPRALAAGDELALGAPSAAIDRAGTRIAPPEYPEAVAAVPGPHDARLPDAGAFFRAAWIVSEASDRMGTRLEGEPLATGEGELLTCGVVAGAVQVPHGGSPIVLGPDHQTTGGYAVVATVASADLGAVAQRLPGEALRFFAVDPAGAVARLGAAEAALAAIA